MARYDCPRCGTRFELAETEHCPDCGRAWFDDYQHDDEAVTDGSGSEEAILSE